MKDILMVVHTMGTMLPSDNDRFSYIAKMLLDRGASIEMVTSDFEHHKKRYRNLKEAGNQPYKVTFLHENAYKKNVSLARIIGHYSFAMRLKKYLLKRKKPDLIYCAVPPLSSAEVAMKYANKEHIPFAIDVQDLWPEAFGMVIGNNLLSNAVLAPLRKKADRIYSHADMIFAVSKTYLNRASHVNHRAKVRESVFLGTDSIEINKIIQNSQKTWEGGQRP